MRRCFALLLALLPLDGFAIPGLSAADLQMVQVGQAVDIQVGNGSVTIQTVKPAD